MNFIVLTNTFTPSIKKPLTSVTFQSISQLKDLQNNINYLGRRCRKLFSTEGLNVLFFWTAVLREGSKGMGAPFDKLKF